MIILFALKYAPETTDISTAILDVVKSPAHFWLLFFYWQSLLLLTADEKGAEAKEKGRSVDIGKKIGFRDHIITRSLTHPLSIFSVWQPDKLKIGIMERNYVTNLMYIDSMLGRDEASTSIPF